MAKGFHNYQYVGVREKTERDERESRSKFWNKGKFDNFVKPFLPRRCNDMVFVDVGCGAGIFLKLAEDMGFSKVIGIEANKEAFRIAEEYKRRNSGKYELYNELGQRNLSKLPVADFTIWSNVHYYIYVSEWLDYVHLLQNKTRFCIIVTAEKRPDFSVLRAQPDIKNLRYYFADWEETGFMSNVSLEDDPAPRKLKSICFKSKKVERVRIDSLVYGAGGSDGHFYKQVEEKVKLEETEYYKWLRNHSRSRRRWSEDSIRRYVRRKMKLFWSIKEHGMLSPVIINSKNSLLDGHHRYRIMEYMGHDTILVKKVI